MVKTRLSLIGILALLAFVPAQAGFAGIAPPTNSPGGSIAPDPNSADAKEMAKDIALVSQRIELVVQATNTEIAAGQAAESGDFVRAQVIGTFVLRNNANTDMPQAIAFPLSDVSGLKNMKGSVSSAENFALTVNGNPFSTTNSTRPNPYGENEPPIQYAAALVDLPAQGDTTLVASYSTPAAGTLPVAQFNIALDSARAWAGRVGESEIVLTLPYPATRENVFLDDSTAGAKFDGNTVRWTRKRFEPSNNDNFQVNILAPQIWQAILDARAAAQANPNDANAQLGLIKAYRTAIAMVGGAPSSSTQNFVSLAEKAFQNALKLNPNSADIHSEYAQLLFETQLAQNAGTRRGAAVLSDIVTELQAALTLDPNNANALKLLAQVKPLVIDLNARTPSRASSALMEKLAKVEAVLGANAAVPTPEPTSVVVTSTQTNTQTAQATPVPMDAATQKALADAQAVISAATTLTTTPNAPMATAIVQAQATLAAHTAAMSATQPTVELVATVATTTSVNLPAVSGNAPTDSGATKQPIQPRTLVAENGWLMAVSIACGVLLLLGVLAAVLVAALGRGKSKTETVATTGIANDATKVTAEVVENVERTIEEKKE